MYYRTLTTVAFILFTVISNAQTTDSTKSEIKKDKVKKGWNIGALPVVAYDADMGLRYGALANLFHYGDGSVYPDYRHSIYLESFRTTLGSGTTQFTYDSKYLIPKIRVTAEASRLTEQALDFYGFNGFEAYYNPNLEDKDNADYISRVFITRPKLTRLKLDFQGKVIAPSIRWFAGLTHFNTSISKVDIDKLNKGKSGSDLIPKDSTLYEKFVTWGFIPDDQKKGGVNNMVTLGLVYDTRDNEPNPMKGMWSEAMLLSCPSFLDNKFAYYRIALTHRQYFTLKPEVLNFAYRLSYQAKLGGTMPFYMLPYFYNPKQIKDGLGGAKTLRGIKRNRVVGEDFIVGNVELRWKFLRTILWNQNIYVALALFADFGLITGKYPVKLKDNSPQEAKDYLKEGSSESLHISYGSGLYIAMNRNFIIAATYGLAGNKQDGNSGFYMSLDFLF